MLPLVNAAMIDLFLARFAAALPADAHAVLVLDGAGWHDERALSVPGNLTLVPLPAYSPELNPLEQAMALPARALPVAAPLSRHRGHHRGLLPRLERPHR